MITQISASNINGVAQDPRRKAQLTKFRNSYGDSYRSENNEDVNQPQRRGSKTLEASLFVFCTALLIMVSYFIIAGLKNAKNEI